MLSLVEGMGALVDTEPLVKVAMLKQCYTRMCVGLRTMYLSHTSTTSKPGFEVVLMVGYASVSDPMDVVELSTYLSTNPLGSVPASDIVAHGFSFLSL